MFIFFIFNFLYSSKITDISKANGMALNDTFYPNINYFPRNPILNVQNLPILNKFQDLTNDQMNKNSFYNKKPLPFPNKNITNSPEFFNNHNLLNPTNFYYNQYFPNENRPFTKPDSDIAPNKNLIDFPENDLKMQPLPNITPKNYTSPPIKSTIHYKGSMQVPSQQKFNRQENIENSKNLPPTLVNYHGSPQFYSNPNRVGTAVPQPLATVRRIQPGDWPSNEIEKLFSDNSDVPVKPAYKTRTKSPFKSFKDEPHLLASPMRTKPGITRLQDMLDHDISSFKKKFPIRWKNAKINRKEDEENEEILQRLMQYPGKNVLNQLVADVEQLDREEHLQKVKGENQLNIVCWLYAIEKCHKDGNESRLDIDDPDNIFDIEKHRHFLTKKYAI